MITIVEIIAQLEDPLINWGAERTIEVTVWILGFAIAAIVGLLNRKLEHAIVIAIISSMITIAFFVIR